LRNFINNGWTEDFGTWIFGAFCGAIFVHKKFLKPLLLKFDRHHKEEMSAHGKTHQQLGINNGSH
jgi:hypothetical protein